jgi:thiol-disulfide isomerase/thioredoxin
MKNYNLPRILASLLILGLLAYLSPITTARAAVSDMLNTATISVTYKGAHPTDSLILMHSSFLHTRHASTDYVTQTAGLTGGRYRFTVRFKGPVAYFMIGKSNPVPDDSERLESVAVSADNFVEPGDNLVIAIEPLPVADKGRKRPEFLTVFRGKGAEKCTFITQANLAARPLMTANIFRADGEYDRSNEPVKFIDSLRGLLKNERKITPFAADLMLTDLYYGIRSHEALVVDLKFKRVDEQHWRTLLADFERTVQQQTLHSDTTALLKSQTYSQFALSLLHLRSKKYDRPDTVDLLVDTIARYYQGVLRDRMIVQFLKENNSRLKNYDQTVSRSADLLTSDVYRSEVAPFLNRMTEAKAYNFSLPDRSGKKVSLAEFAGKTVLLDFWFTGCSNCIKFYAATLKPVHEYFKNRKDVVFITICIDRNKAVWLKSIDDGTYTSNDAINLYTEGQMNQHPSIQHYQVYSYPQPMLIGKDQRIQKVNFSEKMDKEQMIRTIERYSALELSR